MMKTEDREARTDKALADLKWWSDLVRIFVSWAVSVAATVISYRAVTRITDDDPFDRYPLAFATTVTFMMVGVVALIFSAKVVWLFYCFVSDVVTSDDDGKHGFWSVTASVVYVSSFAVGMLSLALSISNIQLEVGYFDSNTIVHSSEKR